LFYQVLDYPTAVGAEATMHVHVSISDVVFALSLTQIAIIYRLYLENMCFDERAMRGGDAGVSEVLLLPCQRFALSLPCQYLTLTILPPFITEFHSKGG
jgi:hypothetical protein